MPWLPSDCGHRQRFRERLRAELDAGDLQETVARAGVTEVQDVNAWQHTPPSRSQVASFGLISKPGSSDRQAAAQVVVDLTQTPTPVEYGHGRILPCGDPNANPSTEYVE